MEAEAAYFGHIVDLVGHLVWPAIVVIAILAIIFFTKPEDRKGLFGGITSLKFGPGGFEMNRQVNLINSKMESLDVRYDQLKQLVYQEMRQELERRGELRDGTEGLVGGTSVPPELMELAATYAEADEEPEWRKRVARKDDAANRMGNYINTHRVSRDLLAEQGDKGLVIGLASAVHSSPEPGDADRLLKIAPTARWLHVKYRVLMAFASLAQRKLLELAHVDAALRILKSYEDDRERAPDKPLQRRIEATRRLLQQYEQDIK